MPAIQVHEMLLRTTCTNPTYMLVLIIKNNNKNYAYIGVDIPIIIRITYTSVWICRYSWCVYNNTGARDSGVYGQCWHYLYTLKWYSLCTSECLICTCINMVCIWYKCTRSRSTRVDITDIFEMTLLMYFRTTDASLYTHDLYVVNV